MGRSANNTRLPICLCVTVCIVPAATYCALARRNIYTYRQSCFVLVSPAKLMCFPCRLLYLNRAITYTGTPMRVSQYTCDLALMFEKTITRFLISLHFDRNYVPYVSCTCYIGIQLIKNDRLPSFVGKILKMSPLLENLRAILIKWFRIRRRIINSE